MTSVKKAIREDFLETCHYIVGNVKKRRKQSGYEVFDQNTMCVENSSILKLALIVPDNKTETACKLSTTLALLDEKMHYSKENISLHYLCSSVCEQFKQLLDDGNIEIEDNILPFPNQDQGDK